jgi:hypothetical protein
MFLIDHLDSPYSSAVLDRRRFGLGRETMRVPSGDHAKLPAPSSGT